MTNKEEIKNLKRSLSDITARIDELEKEPKIEVGWYKNTANTNWICYYDGSEYIYGFDHGIWTNPMLTPEKDSMCGADIPATHKEVEDALISEAVKKGVDKSNMTFFIRNQTLYGTNSCIAGGYVWKEEDVLFRNGKWAEIVVEEKKKPFITIDELWSDEEKDSVIKDFTFEDIFRGIECSPRFEHCEIIDVDLNTFFSEVSSGYVIDVNGKKYKYNKVSLEPKKNRAMVWYDIEIIEDEPRWTLENLKEDHVGKRIYPNTFSPDEIKYLADRIKVFLKVKGLISEIEEVLKLIEKLK